MTAYVKVAALWEEVVETMGGCGVSRLRCKLILLMCLTGGVWAFCCAYCGIKAHDGEYVYAAVYGALGAWNGLTLWRLQKLLRDAR